MGQIQPALEAELGEGLDSFDPWLCQIGELSLAWCLPARRRPPTQENGHQAWTRFEQQSNLRWTRRPEEEIEHPRATKPTLIYPRQTSPCPAKPHHAHPCVLSRSRSNPSLGSILTHLIIPMNNLSRVPIIRHWLFQGCLCSRSCWRRDREVERWFQYLAENNFLVIAIAPLPVGADPNKIIR